MLSHTPTAEEWRELYTLAKKQTMVGIAFCGVEKLPVEQRPQRVMLFQWCTAAERIKSLNEEMDRKTLAVANKFLEEGFPGVVLKGQGMAQLYNVERSTVNSQRTMEGDTLACTKTKTKTPTRDECFGLTQNTQNTQNYKSLHGEECDLNSQNTHTQACASHPDGELCLTQTTQKYNNDDEDENADAGGASVATAVGLSALRSAACSPSHPEGTLNSKLYTLNTQLGHYRTPGDIDIWLHGERDEILEYVRRHIPDCKPVYHHVDFPVLDDVSIEVHFTPTWMNSPLRNRRLQRFFHSFYSQFSNFNSSELPVPNNAFNRIYILVHIYRHLFAEGVGLRQLLDYYFVLKQGFTEVEREETLRTLRSLGMMRFTRAVMWVLQEVFGMPDRYLLTSPDAKEGRFLLDEIMLAGNFGKYDERMQRVEGEGTFRWGLRKVLRNFRFVRSYPSEVLWSPIFKVWHLFWRKKHLWCG